MKIDPFAYHEAMDRTSVLLELLDLSIATHPVTKHHPEVFKSYEKVAEALAELYQVTGSLAFKEDPK